MAFPGRELPYAWPPSGWPPFEPEEKIEPRLWLSQRFFAFVAGEDALDPEFARARIESGESDAAVRALKRVMDARRELGRERESRVVVLDMIDAWHFLESARNLPDCPTNDPAAANERRFRLEESVLRREYLRVATLPLSDRAPFEADYIANFQPSTWHRVVIVEDTGLPLLLANDYEDEDGALRYLYYAAPATVFEAARLNEIISLNHIPDAGA